MFKRIARVFAERANGRCFARIMEVRSTKPRVRATHEFATRSKSSERTFRFSFPATYFIGKTRCGTHDEKLGPNALFVIVKNYDYNQHDQELRCKLRFKNAHNSQSVTKYRCNIRKSCHVKRCESVKYNNVIIVACSRDANLNLLWKRVNIMFAKLLFNFRITYFIL